MKKLIDTIVLDLVKASLGNTLAKHIYYKSFKIGKTTQTLDERFSQNYADEYEGIELLYDGGIKGDLIDQLEEEMIKYCLDTYGDECDNDQLGGGPACTDNSDKDHTAKLYVVWK